MKTTNFMRSWKTLAISACFSAMFFAGCEQPVSSVMSGDDVAASYSQSGENRILGGDLAGIFEKLNLTADQRAAIDALKRAHHECQTPILEALKASERAIAEDFKASRRAIEASDMPREEKHAALRSLEAAQKEAMKNNPQRAIAEAGLKACHETFIEGVRTTLTEEQLVVFNEWLANPTKGDGKKGDGRKGDDKKGDDKKGDGKKGDDKRGDDKRDKKDRKDNKGDIFKKLNLSADQQGAIEILKQAHHDCITPLLEALKASERAIAQSFAAEREAIRANTTMTREEKQAAMRAIDMRQREAMKNNPERAAALAALKACHDTFNTAVRELLTPEQQVIWDNHIARGNKK